MKRKRIYAILMVAIMALTSGCGNTEDTNKTDASVAESSTSETMETGKVGVQKRKPLNLKVLFLNQMTLTVKSRRKMIQSLN